MTNENYNGDGKLIVLTAVNPTTGNQKTRYEFGVTLADSAVASNSLLRSTIYPDSKDPLDRVLHCYNRQGEVTRKTDQNGTVHDYLRDKLGRLTDDVVTTLGHGIDGAVRRIGRTYEVRGLLEKVTSHSAPTGGTVVNEVQLAYNDFAQPITEYQEHGGAVTTSTSPKVQYGYETEIANTSRLISLTYPDGRTLEYGYPGEDNDQLSRIGSLTFGHVPSSSSNSEEGTEVAAYVYMGLGTFETVTYPESGIARTFAFTRFGQPTDWRWKLSSTTLDGVSYTYDRLGSRTSRENLVSSTNSELYTNDGLQRLIAMARGQLTLFSPLPPGEGQGDGAPGVINDVKLAQQWKLDATGNWSGFVNTDLVTPVNSVDQQRASNLANEIEAISRAYGADWFTPAYDRAGNMTQAPLPIGMTDSYGATYDAWNRLASLDAVGSYAYDGLNRRVSSFIASTSTTRHFYYSRQWQVLEERVNGDPVAVKRQFVWGTQYIDDLVLRDRSTTGTLNERLYSLYDGNWNVTSICDTAGDIQERYCYTPYGDCTVLDASLAPREDNESLYAWETRYASYRWDSESGLYQVRYRYLHALLGCWLTRDPLDENRPISYAYVQNAPIVHSDPAGLWEWPWSASASWNPFDTLRTWGANPGSVDRLQGLVNDPITEISNAANPTGIAIIEDFFNKGKTYECVKATTAFSANATLCQFTAATNINPLASEVWYIFPCCIAADALQFLLDNCGNCPRTENVMKFKQMIRLFRRVCEVGAALDIMKGKGGVI